MVCSKEKEIILSVLELYRDMPYLWQKSHKDYLNKELRVQGMKVLLEVYKIFDEAATLATLKKKLLNLRTNYKKELSKVISSKTTGGGDEEVYTPTLWYFDALNFLGSTSESYRKNTDTLESEEKGLNYLKTGKKCKLYDTDDEVTFEIVEQDPAHVTSCDEDDPLDNPGTSDDQVISQVEIETSPPTAAALPQRNATESRWKRKRPLAVDNDDNTTGIRKQKIIVDLQLAKVKLGIAKRESYKLDLELLKLERELNITRHSTFTLPIVMQSDCKYAHGLGGH